MTLEVALVLAAEMLDLFERSPQAKRLQVPVGRRDDVVALLTRAMTRQEFFDQYVGGLRAEIGRRSKAYSLRLLTYGSPEIPDAQIVATGFTDLPDEVLADLATSPHALEAVKETLFEDENSGAPGPWFFAPETFRWRDEA